MSEDLSHPYCIGLSRQRGGVKGLGCGVMVQKRGAPEEMGSGLFPCLPVAPHTRVYTHMSRDTSAHVHTRTRTHVCIEWVCGGLGTFVRNTRFILGSWRCHEVDIPCFSAFRDRWWRALFQLLPSGLGRVHLLVRVQPSLTLGSLRPVEVVWSPARLPPGRSTVIHTDLWGRALGRRSWVECWGVETLSVQVTPCGAGTSWPPGGERSKCGSCPLELVVTAGRQT